MRATIGVLLSTLNYIIPSLATIGPLIINLTCLFSNQFINFHNKMLNDARHKFWNLISKSFIFQMSELVERCFVAFLEDHDDFEFLKDDLITSLASKTLLPIHLVEALEEGLNSKETKKRSRACELLAQVMESIVLILSSEDQLHFARFFTSKFKDWSCLLGGLQGTLHLLNQPNPRDEIVLTISDAFFEFLEIQSLKLSQRLVALKVLSLLIKSGKVLFERDFQLDLIEKTIASIDGEKDPRCLVLVFKIVQDLVVLYSQPFMDSSTLARASEELFDVIACYFPINDSEDLDSDSWEPKQLVHELNEALTCTSLFSEFCFSLILEKINSEHRFAKLNSLLCLQSCATKFPFHSFLEYLTSIWSAIKPFVFGDDLDVIICEHAMLTIQSLCQMSLNGHLEWTTMTDLLFGEERLLDLVTIMRNEDSKSQSNLEISLSFLEKVAWLSDHTIQKTINCILDPILTYFKDWISSVHHTVIDTQVSGHLEKNLSFFLRLLHQLSSSLRANYIKEVIGKKNEAMRELTKWIKALYSLLNNDIFLQEKLASLLEYLLPIKMHIYALNGFLELFTDAECTQQINGVFREVFSERRFDLSKKLNKTLMECYELMISLSETSVNKQHFSELSSELSLPLLIPMELFVLEDDMESKKVWNDYSFAFLAIKPVEWLFEKTLQIQFLEVSVQSSPANGQMILKTAIQLLRKWIQQCHENSSKQNALAVIMQFLRKRVVEKDDFGMSHTLLCSLLEAFRDTPQLLHWFNQYLQNELILFFCKLVQECNADEKNTIIKEVNKPGGMPMEFKLGAICGTNAVEDIFPTLSSTFEFLHNCVEQDDATDVSLKAFALAHILQNYKLEPSDLKQFLSTLISPKRKADQLLFVCLALRGILTGSYSYSVCSESTLQLLSSAIQSLENYLENQTKLPDEISGEDLIGKVFQSLVSDRPFFGFTGCLQWKTPLMRQRAFSICLEVILSALKASLSNRGPMRALGYILIGAKSELVRIEWKRVLHWIIHLVDCLHLDTTCGNELLVQVVEILSELLKEAKSKDSIKDQRNDLLRCLLQISQYQDSAELRVIGIRALMESQKWLLTTSDEVKLYLPQIMNILTTALDDKKRKVRQAAVKCKTKLASLKSK